MTGWWRSRFKLIALTGVLLLGGLAATVLASEAPAGCEPVTYRLLPGEFNYCLGRSLWEKKHFPQAVEMLELAASWGSRPAKLVLGVAYFNGEGVAKDRGRGLAWLQLASARDDRLGRPLYEGALRSASDSEKNRMQDVLTVLRPKYSDDIAVPRAARRFKRELAKLRSNPAYGMGMCVIGLNASSADFGVNSPQDETNPPKQCSMASEQAFVDDVMIRYEQYFHGVREAEVILGPLQKVR